MSQPESSIYLDGALDEATVQNTIVANLNAAPEFRLAISYSRAYLRHDDTNYNTWKVEIVVVDNVDFSAFYNYIYGLANSVQALAMSVEDEFDILR